MVSGITAATSPFPLPSLVNGDTLATGRRVGVPLLVNRKLMSLGVEIRGVCTFTPPAGEWTFLGLPFSSLTLSRSISCCIDPGALKSKMIAFIFWAVILVPLTGDLLPIVLFLGLSTNGDIFFPTLPPKTLFFLPLVDTLTEK